VYNDRTTMARKKKFKLFKINKNTLLNVIGVSVIGSGVLLLISYFQSGEILATINQRLTGGFGFISLLIPAILILLGTHFFNSKKLRLIKANITLGLALIFISLLGLLRSGNYGGLIFENLSLDFSHVGAVLILCLIFFTGLILFLNTSVDVVLLFFIDTFKTIFPAEKKKGGKSKVEEKRGLFGFGKKGDESQFIKDSTKVAPVLNKAPTPVSTTSNPNAIHIRPLSKESQSSWVFPPLSLLSDITQKEADRGDIGQNSDIIEKTLESFGIRARVSEVNPGPTVTQYALEIVMGTKLSRITALGDDLALALAASTGQVRIEAPIPGRSMVGIEIPNKTQEIVTMKRLFSSDVFSKNDDPMLVPMGLDVSGHPIAGNVGKMPHVLIAGTTGSGKSVMLNAWICSFLFRTKPEELRMIMVDPKRVELTLYNGVPHLLTEVIVEPDKAISALKWTVAEMENRYKMFSKVGVRNLEGYNALGNVEKMPFIIFVIDELADLMIFAASEAEELITRIAQMARATGIHLILATQRPSVDVITGLMKANIPSRIAFNVPSLIDSRVVLDMPGAEKLLGKGDMLYLPSDQAKPRRIQGPFISEKEVTEVVKFLKAQTPVVHYTEEVTTQDVSVKGSGKGMGLGGGGDNDPLFQQSMEIVTQFGKASASLLQRRLSIGYARAAKILDQLEAAGVVGPAEGSKPREVINRNPSQGSAEGTIEENTQTF
ncbi:MAG TPA: DNA translocase FtsK, partial [Candidatus Nitrosocosmicus sp.]|nr:DNA translocase FtsK [Candidatus Nitrosocosmicus sp.]